MKQINKQTKKIKKNNIVDDVTLFLESMHIYIYVCVCVMKQAKKNLYELMS